MTDTGTYEQDTGTRSDWSPRSDRYWRHRQDRQILESRATARNIPLELEQQILEPQERLLPELCLSCEQPQVLPVPTSDRYWSLRAIATGAYERQLLEPTSKIQEPGVIGAPEATPTGATDRIARHWSASDR